MVAATVEGYRELDVEPAWVRGDLVGVPLEWPGGNPEGLLELYRVADEYADPVRVWPQELCHNAGEAARYSKVSGPGIYRLATASGRDVGRWEVSEGGMLHWLPLDLE
jgi:hypothetical protein